MAHPDKHLFLMCLQSSSRRWAGFIFSPCFFHRWILSASLFRLGPQAEGTTPVWSELVSCSREQEQGGRWKFSVPLNMTHGIPAHILLAKKQVTCLTVVTGTGQSTLSFGKGQMIWTTMTSSRMPVRPFRLHMSKLSSWSFPPNLFLLHCYLFQLLVSKSNWLD